MMLVGRLPSVTRNGVMEGGRSLRRQLVRRLAEAERLGLREQIGHQEVVLPLLSGLSGRQNPIMSQGTSFVPWWSSW